MQAIASHHLIDAHLAILARRLPADAVDELADGLTETWQHQLAAGLPPADAARTALRRKSETSGREQQSGQTRLGQG
ncbi:hypothetical protein [Micromonospora sp. NPDC005305]|uniref:hypothetical protein n=1 Tax=Micromonospora sp. NPDC005305 TaxID=3156875 RepID=UPI0033BDA75D